MGGDAPRRRALLRHCARSTGRPGAVRHRRGRRRLRAGPARLRQRRLQRRRGVLRDRRPHPARRPGPHPGHPGAPGDALARARRPRRHPRPHAAAPRGRRPPHHRLRQPRRRRPLPPARPRHRAVQRLRPFPRRPDQRRRCVRRAGAPHAHRRLGAAGDPPAAAAPRREQQPHRAHHAGIAPDPALLIEGLGGPTHGYDAIEPLLALADRPTAIFCANDRTAWGAYQALQAHGVRVPDDISIIGFDNQEIIATGLHPQLTSVELPFVVMAKRAIDVLADPAAYSLDQPIACPIIERSSIVNRPRP